MPSGSTRLTMSRAMSCAIARACATAAVLVAVGCYRNVAVAPDTLVVGTTARLYLTPTGTAQLAPRLGEATIALDGRVERVGADGIALVVSQTTKAYGGTIAWVGERVTVPSALVAHAERRTLDRGRTAAIVASTTIAAAVAIGVLIGQHGAGSGADPGNGGVITTP